MGERAGNTIAASELGPVHGHDPQVDKLAAVPHGTDNLPPLIDQVCQRLLKFSLMAGVKSI